MHKIVFKSLIIGLIGVSFSACTDSNTSLNNSSSAKESLSKNHISGTHSDDSISSQHQKNLKKKRRERFEARKRQRAKELAKETKKKTTKKLTKKVKFCFKDSKSIHYRASQRCK